ncbi:hypothetical protein [Brevibacillus fulvus]|uniref:Uncharacterized protein n=1 Tax=Brevibacillus fulvus TaxID=1125967 RepID=A0A939BTQ2_9BACL|nr:hypothetical protein [Brevibacillus fulvus]MBM7588691.1 hypothetical protein [Brevibacillus fulvus]
MNDGVLSLVIQWCLLCLVWMGSLDQPLRRISLSRKQMLAIVTAILLCSMVSWRLYFLPISVNISGALLPLLAAGWLYYLLPERRRRYLLVASCFIAMLLYFLRKLLFGDPVLLLLEEVVMVPVAVNAIALVMTRNSLYQLFLVMLAMPLSDAFYTLSFLGRGENPEIGGGYAQDLLWSSLVFWAAAALSWSTVRRMMRFVQEKLAIGNWLRKRG